MKTSARSTLLAIGLVAGGLVAGPLIGAEGTSAPPVASESLAEAGAPSVFVPIVAYRALDSRSDIGKMDVDGEPFGEGSPILRFFADLSIESPDVQIPAEAIAVSYNITVTETEGSGFLAVAPANTSGPTPTSSINWTSDGLDLANSGNVLLGPNNDDGNGSDSLDITIGGRPGTRTHVIIDITGYYLPV